MPKPLRLVIRLQRKPREGDSKARGDARPLTAGSVAPRDDPARYSESGLERVNVVGISFGRQRRRTTANHSQIRRVSSVKPAP
jgi:hypothetical protein